MTTYEPTGPRISESQFVRTFNEDGDIISGIVTGVSEEGFDVKWEDMEHESNYNFSDINISKDFIYENLQTFLFKVYQTGFIEGCKHEEDVVKNMFQTDPVNFLLSNAIRYFTEAQLIALRDALIERTPPAPAQGVEEGELIEFAKSIAEAYVKFAGTMICAKSKQHPLLEKDSRNLLRIIGEHIQEFPVNENLIKEVIAQYGIKLTGSRWQQGQGEDAISILKELIATTEEVGSDVASLIYRAKRILK